jgi:predicted glycosyltransferase
MTLPTEIAEPGVRKRSVETPATAVRRGAGKKIWIDLDNSPHVPFFMPIIEELEQRGYRVILTARNSYQVRDLLKFHHISCSVIGGHWGKNRTLKILGTLLRATQLLPLMIGKRADLAVSHGSRAQLLTSFVLGIPTVTIVDYEFIAKVPGLKSDWIFMPHYIPNDSLQRAKKEVMRYPGLKEDVYVPRFRPDPSLRSELGLTSEDLVITVRPPATEAHYHNAEADVLLDASLKLLMARPDVRVILVPRNEKQTKILRKDWAEFIQNRRIIIPEHVVDGLNLIWNSDLVISGGGTMNREAAALGVPVYSIFRGLIGGVDKYLASSGRLALIESVEDVRTKIILKRRDTASQDTVGRASVLESVVAGIISIAEHQRLPEHP